MVFITIGYVNADIAHKRGISKYNQNGVSHSEDFKRFSTILQDNPDSWEHLKQNKEVILGKDVSKLYQERIKEYLLQLLPDASNSTSKKEEIHHIFGQQVHLAQKGSPIDKKIRFWNDIYNLVTKSLELEKKLYLLYTPFLNNPHEVMIRNILVEHHNKLSIQEILTCFGDWNANISEPLSSLNLKELEKIISDLTDKKIVRKNHQNVVLTDKGLLI